MVLCPGTMRDGDRSIFSLNIIQRAPTWVIVKTQEKRVAASDGFTCGNIAEQNWSIC
jgi:hypothetical protein